MVRPSLSAHERASVLIVGRRCAEALAIAALDPGNGLSPRTRAALADLVVAVDIAACRAAGVEPPAPELREALRAALADPGSPRAPPAG